MSVEREVGRQVVKYAAGHRGCQPEELKSSNELFCAHPRERSFCDFDGKSAVT